MGSVGHAQHPDSSHADSPRTRERSSTMRRPAATHVPGPGRVQHPPSVLKSSRSRAEPRTEASSHGGDVSDEWHIRIEQRYIDNEAGAGARAKERELAGDKGTARRFLERLLDVETEDRNWRRGARGEERVAAYLASLGQQWAVVHDLTIGRKGANLDHLVIGPPGVFVLNTKNLTGRLTVYEHAILQNGHKTAFVPSALREARTVQQRLSAAAGREVQTWSCLVVMGCEIDVKKPLANLTLVPARSLPRWLDKRPGGALSAGAVLELERLARTPATWFPETSTTRPPAPRAHRPPPPSRPEGQGSASNVEPRRPDPSPASPPSPPRTEPVGHSCTGSVTVRRWKRYGKDRLYANGADGRRLGYLDVTTGEIVLEFADPTGTIAAHLRTSHRALGGPPANGDPQG